MTTSAAQRTLPLIQLWLLRTTSGTALATMPILPMAFTTHPPSFGGISGAFSYSLDEKTAGRSAVTSLHVKYEGGPLYVGFGYQNQNPYGPEAATKFIRLNGTYDLGVAKVLAGYGKVDYPGTSANATDWELGVDVPMSSTLTLSGGVAGSKLAGVKSTGYALAAAYSCPSVRRCMVVSTPALKRTPIPVISMFWQLA
jgi:hypothetical protein